MLQLPRQRAWRPDPHACESAGDGNSMRPAVAVANHRAFELMAAVGNHAPEVKRCVEPWQFPRRLRWAIDDVAEATFVNG